MRRRQKFGVRQQQRAGKIIGQADARQRVGRAVVDETGAPIGTVKSIENFGASDILDIALASGGSVMVPFVADVVREEADCLIVDKAWLQ